MNRLAVIDSKLKKSWSYEGLMVDYHFVVSLWRSFADHSFDNISGASFERALPKMPDLKNEDASLPLYTPEQIEFLDQKQSDLEKSLRTALHAFEIQQEQDALTYSRVLLQSGKLRSKQHQRLIQLGNSQVQKMDADHMYDLWREIRIIPVRWTATFYSKVLEFRDNSRAGMTGYIYIAKQSGLFLFLIGFCAFFVWTFSKLVLRFEDLTERLIRKISNLHTHWLVPYFLTVANKSIPWFLLLFGIWFLISVIEITAFNELSSLLPYLDFYIYYRLALIFTTSFYFRFKAIGKINILLRQ